MPRTSTGAHSATDNTIIPEGGVKSTSFGYTARIKDRGINYKIDFQDGETQHVSKSNHPQPPNLRKVKREAVKKSEEKSLP